MQDKAFANSKISFEWNSELAEVKGVEQGVVTGVVLRNLQTGDVKELLVEGVFVAIGHTPNTGLFRGQLGLDDNGGIHTNSLIATHAYYLAIEGGTNRVSGLDVTGVGAANREQMEQIFFRAFTQFLTPLSTFADARAATIQAARDIYGVGSTPEAAVIQAWDAVGVQ